MGDGLDCFGGDLSLIVGGSSSIAGDDGLRAGEDGFGDDDDFGDDDANDPCFPVADFLIAPSDISNGLNTVVSVDSMRSPIWPFN